jgi:hypothetical protein
MNSTLDKSFIVNALRAELIDFERQAEPEKDWWIFERSFAYGNANERLTITISSAQGSARFVAKYGLRFEPIATLEARVWNDDNRLNWASSGGLECPLSGYIQPNGKTALIQKNDDLIAALQEIRLAYDVAKDILKDNANSIASVCQWFDKCPDEAGKFAGKITFAIFNLAAGQFARADDIASECLSEQAALPAPRNRMTTNIRDRYRNACLTIRSLAGQGLD